MKNRSQKVKMRVSIVAVAPISAGTPSRVNTAVMAISGNAQVGNTIAVEHAKRLSPHST